MMGDIYGEDIEAAPRPKKKSIFSAEARATVSEGAKALDFFSRGKDTFERKLEEDQRKQEKKRARLERKRSSKSADLKDKSPVDEKRRKPSVQNYTTREYSSEEGSQHEHEPGSPTPRRRFPSHTSPSSRRPRYTEQNLQDPPISLTEKYSRELNLHNSQQTETAKGYISLSDSDDNEETFAKKTTVIAVKKSAHNPISLSDDDDDFYTAPKKPVPIPDDDDELPFSDEEFPEFVQAAREREKLKMKQRLDAAVKSSKETSSVGPDDFDDFFDSPKVEADPVVEILITSKMEGTKPIMVKRKLSQRLREAKHGWCDKQVMPGQTQEDFRNQIFLTWKTHRLHDTTTSRSLGVNLDEAGQLSYDADGMDAEGRIHLLAWTESAYEVYQAREAEKAKKEQAFKEGKIEAEPPVAKTRLIFKARGIPDFKLNARPTTTIEKMIAVFQNARSDLIPDGQCVSLHFDGERLDPESTVEEADLDDLDTVEVHFN